MNHIGKVVSAFILLFSCLASPLTACTTAIISGTATVDGRPLLFKHRDSDSLDNKLMFFDDGTYDYIGLINSSDSLEKQVWAGCNSAGFAIMNSASYNLNLQDTSSVKDREGIIMKQALQSCATLADFEEMLRRLTKPMGAEANFGVIDAHGGAAYYETGNYDFKKYDATDPSIAPFGYIIRTNYSYIGEREEDYGIIRYQTAEDLFCTAYNSDALSSTFLLRDVSRCLKHSLTRTDLARELPPDGEAPHFVFFRDFIPRYYSSATIAVQGVKEDEPPELTTMWTILGFQLCSVAVPVWVEGGDRLPDCLTAGGSRHAPLCDWALQLKDRCMPIDRGAGSNYLNLAVVGNRRDTGILQQNMLFEKDLLKESESRLATWRTDGIKPDLVLELYQWLDQEIRDHYRRAFGFQTEP